jgi:hypothetical protein
MHIRMTFSFGFEFENSVGSMAIKTQKIILATIL